MKKLILCLFLLPGCMKTTILNAPIEREVVDTIYRTKAHKDFEDTTSVETPRDTLEERVQISFNPTVEDWEEN